MVVFIKPPQTKSGSSWQILSSYSHCECFVKNKNLPEWAIPEKSKQGREEAEDMLF